MHYTTLLPLLSLLTFTTASPTAQTLPTVSVNVYNDTQCTVLDHKGYEFKKNNKCQQFVGQEAGFIATSQTPVPDGCVFQVFSDTACADVLAAITINAGYESPILGPASSGKLAGCK